MSLYSHEEICVNCVFAHFYDCCNTFCYCEEGHENDVNGSNGTCKYKDVE